jgi:hypothetical protein
MARDESCLCRVPAVSLGAPLDRAGAEAWALVVGVTLEDDYADRPSVSVEAAYKLASARRVAQAAAEAEREQQYQLLAAVGEANRRRADILDTAMNREMTREQKTPLDRRSYMAAYKRALTAVAKFDETLPAEVLARCDGLKFVGWTSEGS